VAIPPQALAASLQELAKQSGIQIIFFSKVVEGYEAPALNGTYTPEAALDKLLAGTNLVYRALNDRTMEVAVDPAVTGVPWVPLPTRKPASEAEVAPDAPIAEVEVTAERANLAEMRAAIVRLEQQFYARYNQLNTNHRYDIILCRSLKITGSHVDRRFCEPAALVTVPRSKVAWLSYQGSIANTEAPASVETPGDPAELRAYQRNMVEVVRRHPELLELVKERNALAERYRAAQLQR
jgi:hypothetical protein